jgi:CRP/FNR family cyclic AMP-dependent transcriptional regulator
MSTNVKKPAASAAQQKSGIKQLKPGEVLFNDGDPAKSLYIIQKGQIRLYKPKGKGFIELAVLRGGEVIGEMAYFDDDGGGRRSCAASALVETEIIEISFVAFGKTMEGLNPWFKMIINTLANRLRKTNARVKELESNSVSVDYGGKASSYEFLKPNDTIKILGTLFLVFKSHGEKHERGVKIHRSVLELYAGDIFGLAEAKTEALMQMMNDLGHLEMEKDQDGFLKIIIIKSLEFVRALFIFFNSEKHLTDDKKLKISTPCQNFLEKIYSLQKYDAAERKPVLVSIQPILDDYKFRNIFIGVEDLHDAKVAGITGEVIVGDDNELLVELYAGKILKLMPIIIFINSLKKLNESRTP